jgi:hypothetical protein
VQEHPSLSKSEKKRLCGLMDCKKLTAEASSHAVQNERLPLRLVVQVLFFEQLRASASAEAAASDHHPSSALRSLLPRENGNSYGSSRSAATTATTTEDDQWGGGGVPAPGDTSSFRSMSGLGNNKSGGNGGKAAAKGPLKMPRTMLSKLWSGKASSGENSGGSDTSESPGSVNLEVETKSTHSRNTRHSVS